MSVREQRASREEIFIHLDTLLGQNACQHAIQAAELSRKGKASTALKTLKEFDATLGGIGVHSITDKRPLGVYRAWFYVELPLRKRGAEDHSRSMIQSSCVYLEEVLKHLVRQWPWEKIKADGLPLGALVNRAAKHLPADLATELAWLSSGIYNFAKHHYNLNDKFDAQPPNHYFQLDEAIAVYLIARKLGLYLEQLIGKSPEQLMKE
jgi:hypothetical protein